MEEPAGEAVVGGDGRGNGSVGARDATAESAREKLLRQGPQALTDPDLIAVLFGATTRGSPVNGMAEALISAGGGLRALALSDPQELCALPGLGPTRAAQILAALELGRRLQQPTETRPRLRTPAEIFRHVWPDLGLLRREAFHVLCFNSRNVLLANIRIAEGTVDTCPVDPREVFRVALATRAAAVVLVHNHPSGDPDPSGQDVTLTRQLVKAAQFLGIKVLDHLVIGDGAFTSMLEQGRLGRIERETQEIVWQDGADG